MTAFIKNTTLSPVAQNNLKMWKCANIKKSKFDYFWKFQKNLVFWAKIAILGSRCNFWGFQKIFISDQDFWKKINSEFFWGRTGLFFSIRITKNMGRLIQRLIFDFHPFRCLWLVSKISKPMLRQKGGHPF